MPQPVRPQENIKPGGRFVRPDGTTIQNDGQRMVVTNPDGSVDHWDRGGPGGSAGRYLGAGGGGSPQQQSPQATYEGPPVASQGFWDTNRVNNANSYLLRGPRLPGPEDVPIDTGIWAQVLQGGLPQ